MVFKELKDRETFIHIIKTNTHLTKGKDGIYMALFPWASLSLFAPSNSPSSP